VSSTKGLLAGPSPHAISLVYAESGFTASQQNVTGEIGRRSWDKTGNLWEEMRSDARKPACAGPFHSKLFNSIVEDYLALGTCVHHEASGSDTDFLGTADGKCRQDGDDRVVAGGDSDGQR